MWWYIFSGVLLLVLSPILTIIYKLVVTKMRLGFYQKQGLKIYNAPAGGIFHFLSKQFVQNQKGNNLRYIEEQFKKDPLAPGIVFNRVDQAGCMILLQSVEYSKELVAKKNISKSYHSNQN